MEFKLLRSLAGLFSAAVQDRAHLVKSVPPNPNPGYPDGQGTTYKTIRPERAGRVQVHGSSWLARCEQPIEILPGEIVDIVGWEELTLWVEPAFLLKASVNGLRQIEGAVERQGRALYQSGWLLPGVRDRIKLECSDAFLSDTWQRFIQRKPINIDIFKTYCVLLGLHWQDVVYRSGMESRVSTATPVGNRLVGADAEFVGREGAIAALRQFDQDGTQVVVIQGQGGVGKTTLARQYFQQQPFDLVLECWMAQECDRIPAAESVVQEWLRRCFDEEPAQEFGISLERLRQQLRQQRVGVSIDNLEPALDRNGCFVLAHRDYVELLRVLADPTVQSFTLITSREPLHETSIAVQAYDLQGLDVAAWRQVLGNHQIDSDSPSLPAMQAAYGGNAKAMLILSSAIRMDFAGDLEAYWQENQADLLSSLDLDNLVASHFKRLQHLYPDAYRLLCRLGCYRYQELPTVPFEALSCLLWEVPPEQHRRIVKFLQGLFLLEAGQGGYSLHPAIRAKAMALLRSQPAWERANRQAARFWTERVQTVTTVEDGLRALEAYYHYLHIDAVEQAGDVILHRRDSPWEANEPLGVAFYRLGLLQTMTHAIAQIIDRIPPSYALSKLHNILGDVRWLTGQIHPAIQCHQTSRQVAIDLGFKDLDIVALFNIGLCYIELWELEQAIQYFQTVIALAEPTEFHYYVVGSWFCLAGLKSTLGETEAALKLAQKVHNCDAEVRFSVWSRGYSLLFLGMTYQNTGDLATARQFYDQARAYGEESSYTQVRARALNGLAMVEREEGRGGRAIANHHAAKALLEKIGARCDLAEVCYQLALTHQRLGQAQASKTNFQQAIQLFHQIGAPRQVERVQRHTEA